MPSKEPCIPAKRHATRDCWLLAAAFLLGSSAAGVLQAVCDARQAELLRYYLVTPSEDGSFADYPKTPAELEN